jgi:hypothetical protein
MTTLLVVTAIVEAVTGLALLLSPSLLVSMLLGSSLDTPAALTVGRVAGAALLSLGVACWLGRRDENRRAATGLVAAMLLYNAATTALLAHARIGLGLFGIALWPAVALHGVLTVWCIACLWRQRVDGGDGD